MSSQEEQAWKLCGGWTVPKAWGHQGGRTAPLPAPLPWRLEKSQGVAQDQAGSATPVPSSLGLGPLLCLGLALLPTKGTLSEAQATWLFLIPEP